MKMNAIGWPIKNFLIKLINFSLCMYLCVQATHPQACILVYFGAAFPLAKRTGRTSPRMFSRPLSFSFILSYSDYNLLTYSFFLIPFSWSTDVRLAQLTLAWGREPFSLGKLWVREWVVGDALEYRDLAIWDRIAELCD